MRIQKRIMEIIVKEPSRCRFLIKGEKWFVLYSLPIGKNNTLAYGVFKKGSGTVRCSTKTTHQMLRIKVDQQGFKVVKENVFIQKALQNQLFHINDLSLGQINALNAKRIQTREPVNVEMPSMPSINPADRQRFILRLQAVNFQVSSTA